MFWYRLLVCVCALELVSASSSLISQSCTTEGDCHLGGQCLNQVCVCRPMFSGANCSLLSDPVQYPCGQGSLCLANESTWGGAVTRGDDGKYHMYSALMSNGCTLTNWLTNSQVLHSVADNPQGPYIPSDIALGPRDVSFWDGIAL